MNVNKVLYLLAAALLAILLLILTQKQPAKPAYAPITIKQKPAPTEPHHDTPQNQIEQTLFDLTNKDREQNGLPDLTYDARLHLSAQAKCQDMSQNHYFAHDRGQGIFYFFPKDTAAMGENLEQGDYPPQIIEQAWMDSPGHRQNILGLYDSVGFGECADMTVAHFVLWWAIDKGAF